MEISFGPLSDPGTDVDDGSDSFLGFLSGSGRFRCLRFDSQHISFVFVVVVPGPHLICQFHIFRRSDARSGVFPRGVVLHPCCIQWQICREWIICHHLIVPALPLGQCTPSIFYPCHPYSRPKLPPSNMPSLRPSLHEGSDSPGPPDRTVGYRTSPPQTLAGFRGRGRGRAASRGRGLPQTMQLARNQCCSDSPLVQSILTDFLHPRF